MGGRRIGGSGENRLELGVRRRMALIAAMQAFRHFPLSQITFASNPPPAKTHRRANRCEATSSAGGFQSLLANILIISQLPE